MKRLTTPIPRIQRISAIVILATTMHAVSAPCTYGMNPPASVPAPACAPAQNGWEAVTASNVSVEQDSSQPMTVTSRGGYIYVSLREPATIKVFTILGQQLSQQTLAQGQWRLRMKARGIYIIKAGAVTCRVTV